MLKYQCVQEGFTLTEKKNNEDYEFMIRIKDVERYLPAMKEIREHFEGDDVHTDVLFYTMQNHEYRIIVRQDYYIEFILYLFKVQFVSSVSWS